MCCLIWQRSPDLRLDRFGASISETHYACVSHSFARVLRTFIKTTSATGSPYTCRHSPGGEIGRHSGLKIRRRQNVVPVRVGSGAPISHSDAHGTRGHRLTWEGLRIQHIHQHTTAGTIAQARPCPPGTSTAAEPARPLSAQAKRESIFMDSL